MREDELSHLQGEINAILAFVATLDEVDVEGVAPMTSVLPMRMKRRADVVTESNQVDAILANAPVSEDHLFVVPKVVE